MGEESEKRRGGRPEEPPPPKATGLAPSFIVQEAPLDDLYIKKYIDHLESISTWGQNHVYLGKTCIPGDRNMYTWEYASPGINVSPPKHLYLGIAFPGINVSPPKHLYLGICIPRYKCFTPQTFTPGDMHPQV